MTVHNGTLTRPALTNSDLIDRLVDVPLTIQEAGHVLAYYLPLVDAESPAESWKNHYLVARLHIGALLGRFLDRATFLSAVEVGTEIWARRNGQETSNGYTLWTLEQLHVELSTIIDQLLGGTE